MKKMLQILQGLHFIIITFRILFFSYVIITRISRNASLTDAFCSSKCDYTALKNVSNDLLNVSIKKK